MFDRIKRYLNLPLKTKNIDPWLSGYSGFGWGMTAAGTRVDSITALQSSAILSCVTILSEDLAKLPLAVYRKLDNGGKKVAKDHPVNRLLQCPNDWMTRFEFVQMMQAALVLCSNAYAVIIRDPKGEPQSLIPMHPDYVNVWEAPDGEIFYIVSRSGLHDSAVLRDLPTKNRSWVVHSDDMLHLRWMSTQRSLWGTSRISLLHEAVGLSLALDESTSRIISTAARPGGLLMTDAKLTTEQAQHIVEQFAKNHSGPNNSGGIGLLESGMTYQAMEFTGPEQLVAQRSFQLAEIARGMRVPLYKLGVIEAGDKSDRALIDQGYLNDTMVPYCENWSQRIEKTFDITDEYAVEWDFTHFLRADLKTRIDAARSSILGSICTINEVRIDLGLPAHPSGDLILQGSNMVPLGYLPPENTGQSGPGSDQTGDPAKDGDGDDAAAPEDSGEPTK